ncbi:MAG: methyl-accepting chemotaxis protein [Acidobacteriota bacterium]
MKNWKLSTKLSVVLGATAVLGCLASAALIWRLGAISSDYNTVLRNEVQFESEARVMQVTFKKQVQEWKNILLRGSDPQALAKYTGEFQKEDRAVKDIAHGLQAKVSDPEVHSLLTQFATEHDKLSTGYSQSLENFKRGGGTDFAAADKAVKGQDRAPTDLIDQIVERLNTLAHQRTDALERTSSRQIWAVIIILSICYLIVLPVAYQLLKWVKKVLDHAATELGACANEVWNAARQVSETSQLLARGASDQAAALEETAASSTEMSSMTQSNAASAKTAADVVERANLRVTDAGSALHEMQDSMRAINDSSDQIARIIKVIDEIAFQTNILALNAAVEAARAGEAGMGFAVVADEVRNLAQRSAQAARDTTSLIEDSIQKANAGRQRVDRVSAVMQSLAGEISQAKGLITEVSAGSGEQAKSVDELARALVQIEAITQRITAQAEESASASEELSAQSHVMKDIVAKLC